MRRDLSAQAGAVHRRAIDSKLLKKATLGDPTERLIDIYIPAGHDGRGLPLLIDIVGFTAGGPAHTNWKNFGENLPERLDRLIASGAMPPCVVAFPDCFTKLGGNQYINSDGVGRWADFLMEEAVPTVEKEFGCGGKGKRGIFGKSSGGYGAMVHALLYPDFWSAAAVHSGDMGFDLMYRHEFPGILRALAAVGGNPKTWLEKFYAAQKTKDSDVHIIMMLCQAATFDPDTSAYMNIRLPVDPHTCEFIAERWQNWLNWDPLVIAQTRADDLKKLKMLYIDCGDTDQYNLVYGARRMHALLERHGVAHTYEEFPDNHSSVDYRMDKKSSSARKGAFAMMDTNKLKHFCDTQWDESVIPSITDYIRIPNKSPAFDPKWAEHGYMDQAVSLMEKWAREKIAAIKDAKLEVIRLEGRTPLIFIDLPGNKNDDTVLLYGHLDKQPEMKGWFEGSGPWEPRRDGDKLYGRGSADDGYAIYASITALLALQDQNIPRARCVIVIEACEEFGSYDLPFYIDHLADRLGQPSLVVCLDSGCGNYDQLWLTTSLRGIAMGVLNVRVLTEGVHSGDASGIVPSSFRITRNLLSRVEDEATGAIKLQDLYVQVPPQRIEQAKQAAQILGKEVFNKLPFAGATRPISEDLTDLVLNRTWRPQLAITAIDGYPLPENGGNVLLPYSSTKLSFRLPPTANADKATALIKKTLETDPPYGAEVEFDAEGGQSGWEAPALAPWLEKSIDTASKMSFGKPAAYMGEGGSIPFMGMLGEKFPKTQFVITGVLGPHSNAHGPNEFLHVPTAKKVTASIAQIVADHYARD